MAESGGCNARQATLTPNACQRRSDAHRLFAPARSHAVDAPLAVRTISSAGRRSLGEHTFRSPAPPTKFSTRTSAAQLRQLPRLSQCTSSDRGPRKLPHEHQCASARGCGRLGRIRFAELDDPIATIVIATIVDELLADPSLDRHLRAGCPAAGCLTQRLGCPSTLLSHDR